jgi:hypothetical protein
MNDLKIQSVLKQIMNIPELAQIFKLIKFDCGFLWNKFVLLITKML